VLAAVRPPRSGWQQPRTLSALGGNPDVAASAAGNVIAVWQQWTAPYAVQSERWRGRWLPPVPLSVGDGTDAHVAMNDAGAAIVAWARPRKRTDGGIQSAIARPEAAFPAAQTISRAENAFNPQVAMNARGDVAVAWEVDTRKGCAVRAAVAASGESWSPPQTLSGHTASCSPEQRVAIDAAGRATVVWLSQRGPKTYLQTVNRNATGPWGRTRSLSRANQIDTPTIAENARGDTIVAWAQSRHNEFVIKAASRTSSQPWHVQQIPKSAGLQAQVTIDARGDALVGWDDFRLSGTSARPVRGRWQTPTPITSRPTGLSPIFMSIDAHGNGLAISKAKNALDSSDYPCLFP
jgi:hypothetical protein